MWAKMRATWQILSSHTLRAEKEVARILNVRSGSGLSAEHRQYVEHPSGLGLFTYQLTKLDLDQSEL